VSLPCPEHAKPGSLTTFPMGDRHLWAPVFGKNEGRLGIMYLMYCMCLHTHKVADFCP